MENNPESSDQRFISGLREVIIKNLRDENFGVDELAKETGRNRYYIYRKIKENTGQNVVRFIRNIRLDKALELLRQDAGSASEIAYMVGFGSPAYFNRCFHERFGYTPGEARRQALNGRLPLSGQPEETVSTKADAPVASAGRKKRGPLINPFWLLPVSAGGILVVFILWSVIGFVERRGSGNSLIVTPFANNTGDPQFQFFADGVTESIIDDLLEIENLEVISGPVSDKSMQNFGNHRKTAQIQEADYILEGSVQRDGSRVRIRVKLTEAEKSKLKWSDYYDREIGDIFEIQNNIARNVAGHLNIILTEKEISNITRRYPANPEAYVLYLKGRYFMNQGNRTSSERSIDYFREALNIDPGYALAYAGLADAFMDQAFRSWIDVEEGYSAALSAARKAVELDKNLSEGHAALGNLLCWYERNWNESRKELLLAIDLNPQNELAHLYYSQLMEILGDNDLARRHVNLALELNPFLMVANYRSIICYMHEGRYKESLDEIDRVADVINAKRRYYYTYLNYLALNQDDLFIQNLSLYFSADSVGSERSKTVYELFNAEGKKGVLRWLVNLELAKPRPRYYLLAYWYVNLNENAKAIECLNKAYDTFTLELPEINNDPFFSPLRSEPGFTDLIRNLGL